MKTERRHELQENELATWLGDQIVKLKPYTKLIAGAGILVMLILFATSYLNSRNDEADQEAWAGYFAALATGDPTEFQKVAETFPGTIAAGWSLQSAGDLLLNQGIGELFRNREQAKTQIEAAREAYRSAASGYSDPMLQQRALLGVAKAEESLGNFDEAKKHYEEIVGKWSDSEMADLANNRLAQLERPGTKEWYDWFAQQEPVTSPLDTPGFLNDLPNLPDQPNINLPEAGELLGPDGQASEQTSPSSDADLPALDLPADDGASDAAADTPGDADASGGLDLDTEPATPASDANDSSADATTSQQELPTAETPGEAAADELNAEIPQ